MAKKFTKEDADLLAELGVEEKKAKVTKFTPREERIIAGFEDIQRFVAEHGRRPEHGEDRDIFERLYAVRLDRLRELEECRTLLAPMDTDNLLAASDDEAEALDAENASDAELLEALGVGPGEDDITEIKHVRPQADRKAAQEVARRIPCSDFDEFRPVFEKVQEQLEAGLRQTARFQHNGTLAPGDLFILEGQKVLVAGSGDKFLQEFGREDRRLRVIYDNGTESNLLLRSLQRALYKDEHGRRILPPESESKPLFSDQIAAEDAQSGHIYIARSLSDHPFIVENRDLLHKIGVTGQEVKKRIGNAKKDPTFLLAEVELIETYQLANVNRNKLEKLLHKFFSAARMDVELRDRFDQKVEPEEWFLVPLPTIRKAIELLMSGDIEHCKYDPANAAIIDTSSNEQVE